MPALIYSLCALTSLTCLVLLWRSYRATGTRLLFWSAWCFLLLALNNILLVLDKVIYPIGSDLSLLRLIAALSAVLLLLFGLVWEES